jgi:predicted membrane channel-forming protein YqfA (hemolysin III family)
VTLVSLGWVALFMALSSRTALLGPGLDPWLFLLHLVSILCYFGGAIVLVWAAAIAWTGKRSWQGRVWTSVLALSAVVMLWMAWIYHLTSFTSRY